MRQNRRIYNTPKLLKKCPIRGTTPTPPCPPLRHSPRCACQSKQGWGIQHHTPLEPSHRLRGAHPLALALAPDPDPDQARMGPSRCSLVAVASAPYSVVLALAEVRADANASDEDGAARLLGRLGRQLGCVQA